MYLTTVMLLNFSCVAHFIILFSIHQTKNQLHVYCTSTILKFAADLSIIKTSSCYTIITEVAGIKPIYKEQGI
jgi:hypothetical protein